jgi:hypothetical protein
MNREQEGFSLVVVERGARLPGSEGARHPAHVLVRQRDAESADGLMKRIHGELSYLEANARRVDDATISCGPSLDRAACEARARLTKEVLESLRSTPHARLVLVADRNADAQLRDALASLVEQAVAVLSKNGGSVSLRFVKAA